MEPIIETPRVGSLIWEGERASIAKAFVAAQKATEAVKKASTNPAFRSKYADLAGVVEAVVPALNENGIGVIQAPAFDGKRVSVTTTLLHESGSSVTCVLDLTPSKTDPQGVGSATTYGRRYALLAMTGAAPEDDDGNAASQGQPSRPAMTKANARPEYEALQKSLRACRSVEELTAWAADNAVAVTELPADWAQNLRDEWKSERDAHNAATDTPFDEAA